jgi:hypothetical protein
MGWLAYRNLSFGDASLEWSRPYSFFYGLLISPSAAHIISDQRVTFPWTALWVALSNFGPTNAVDLTGAAIYVTLFIALGARMWSIRPSYFVYTLATLLLSLAYSTGVPYSYMGLIRHCLLAFPIAIVLGAHTRPAWILAMMKVSGVLSLLGLPVLYVWKLLWVP